MDKVATPLHEIQGDSLFSPMAGERLLTSGVVTGWSRRGFFIQDPQPLGDPLNSDAIFVYSPKERPPIGSYMQIEGTVVDYQAAENDKPVTQLKMHAGELLAEQGPRIIPFKLNAQVLPNSNQQLVKFLNGLEGMLVNIAAGATFIQASNPFADYVVALVDDEFGALQVDNGGVLLDADNPERWFPGFRMTSYEDAPKLNVGSLLLSPVSGPLNYRSGAYQIAVNHPIEVQPAAVKPTRATLQASRNCMTVLTLNTFNLDVHIEAPEKVNNPRRDIDDDVGDGRFAALAQAIVGQAASPDVIALQEIQDNDGAEITAVVSASSTYELLISEILTAGGPRYEWVDVAPESHKDGGQPGGNIRNGYLYNPERVSLVAGSVIRLGENSDTFDDSRKPIRAIFRLNDSGAELGIVNVHLASKRHQRSIFAVDLPGFDPRLQIRVKQASIIREEVLRLRAAGQDYYVTGDFNDTEHSLTLATILGEESYNLLESLPAQERYDYNHRGKLHALMHGIVSKEHALNGAESGINNGTEYEILHGNELEGVRPGELGSKASDHAYVIARLALAPTADR